MIVSSVSAYYTLFILEEPFAVCRLPAETPSPDWAKENGLLALIRTSEELSIVCREEYPPLDVQAEKGWRAMKVQGPLEFSQVGVVASLAVPLAQAGVSIFVLSTFETDYILVKGEWLACAVDALRRAGHQIRHELNS